MVLLLCLLGWSQYSRYPAKHENENSRRQRRRAKHSKVKFGAGLINDRFFVDVFHFLHHFSSLSPVVKFSPHSSLQCVYLLFRVSYTILEMRYGSHCKNVFKVQNNLILRLLMSYIYIYIYIYIYGAPILDVSRSHTTTQHSR